MQHGLTRPVRTHLAALTIVGALFACTAGAQDAAPARPGHFQDLGTTIGCIADLEAQRDAKCYATASRLEDFIYGTPLEDGARFAKIDLQKKLIRALWSEASAAAEKSGARALGAESLVPVFERYLSGETTDTGDYHVVIPTVRDWTSKRD